MEEFWDVYDSQKRKTGKMHKKGQPLGENEYHIAVHAWIMNSKNQVLLTQRKADDTFPGKWEPSAGSILAGENSIQGAIREIKEEIGIELKTNEGRVVGGERRDKYHDFYDICLFRKDFDVSQIDLRQTEVADIKWVDKVEFDEMLEKGEILETLKYFKNIYNNIVKKNKDDERE